MAGEKISAGIGLTFLFRFDNAAVSLDCGLHFRRTMDCPEEGQPVKIGRVEPVTLAGRYGEQSGGDEFPDGIGDEAPADALPCEIAF